MDIRARMDIRATRRASTPHGDACTKARMDIRATRRASAPHGGHPRPQDGGHEKARILIRARMRIRTWMDIRATRRASGPYDEQGVNNAH